MKIAIDIDDVLADSIVALVEFHNKTYKTTLKKSDYLSYNLWEVWGGDKNDSERKINEFFQTSSFRDIKPTAGSIKAVTKLKENNDLFVITSRPKGAIEETKKWIEKYYSKIFHKIYFSSHNSLRIGNTKKSDFCDQLDIDVLIEDSFEYAMECRKPNRKIILFKRPWNKNFIIPKDIQVVKNWSEVLSIIYKK